MICDRPYMKPVPIEDADEHDCYGCSGKGFHNWFDVNAGWEVELCPICDGIATAGVFVLRVVTARFQHELRFHAANLGKALKRAERFAELAAGRKLFGSRPSAVQIVFLTTGKGKLAPAELVATIPVPVRPLTPRAA